MTEPALLEIDGLVTSFQTPRGSVRAVDGVSVRVERGQTVCLAGESGCGKSVTALSVMGLLPEAARVEAGAIRLRGVDLLALPPRERRGLRGRVLSMVFQEPMTALNPVLTIGAQVAEVFAIHGTATRREAREKTIALLRQVRLADPERRVDDYPHQLSGGMKQRVMIALALANRPELLIADEPTTALDVTIQAQVLHLLRELQRELGLTLVFIAHDLSVVRHMCDRVAVMYLGKIVEMAGSDELYGHPRHPYTGALMSAVPIADPKLAAVKKRQILAGDVPSPTNPPAACRFHTRCWRPRTAATSPPATSR